MRYIKHLPTWIKVASLSVIIGTVLTACGSSASSSPGQAVASAASSAAASYNSANPAPTVSSSTAYKQGELIFFGSACVTNPNYYPGTNQGPQCSGYRTLAEVNTWPGVTTWAQWCAEEIQNNGVIVPSTATQQGCVWAATVYAPSHPNGGESQA